jgi:uncharacterized membrane protein
MTRTWVVIILVLAFFGLADSAYLAQHALTNTPLLCNVENLSGCNIVASSQYSRLFGLPLAVYGVIFYGILFVLSALEIVLVDRLLRRVLQGAALAGFIASLYFVTVQVFFIGAFCIYCFASVVISLSIIILASRIEPLRKRPPETPPAPPSARPHATEVPKWEGIPVPGIAPAPRMKLPSDHPHVS